MIRAWNIIVKDDSRLNKMMSDSLAIYDQALYFQRQIYFESKKQDKIKTYNYKELYNLVKIQPIFIESRIDYVSKQYVIKQVINNWTAFIKASISFKQNKSKFLGKPKIPNYLNRTKQFNIVQFDKTRLRKINFEENSFVLPCSDYKIILPKQIKIKQIKQITIQKFFGKTKINIIYEDLNIIDNEYINNLNIGIDLGVNNLCAITTNDKQGFSYVIEGGPLKSINQFYNKQISFYKSKLEKCNKKKSSKRIQKLNYKRKNKMIDYMHNSSKQIIDLCIKNKIHKIIIGHNDNWKQKSNMSKQNNQNFIQIPFNVLIDQIKYKASKYSNLEVLIVEESYTSKIDHVALESMEHHKEYYGQRKKRGEFKSSTGKVLNADINGAIGILRKANAISDVQLMDLRNRGDVVSPLKLNLTHKQI